MDLHGKLMMQNINLLPQAYQKEKIILSAQMILVTCTTVIFIFSIIIASQVWALDRKKEELQKAKIQLQNKEKDITEFKASVPKPTLDANLTVEVEHLSEQIKKKQDLIAQLNEIVIKKDNGFANYLKGLSKQHVQGIWLTDIKIQGDGHSILLSGNTLSPELVPTYLERLKKEGSFSGKTFDAVNFKQTALSEKILNFTLELNGDNL